MNGALGAVKGPVADEAVAAATQWWAFCACGEVGGLVGGLKRAWVEGSTYRGGLAGVVHDIASIVDFSDVRCPYTRVTGIDPVSGVRQRITYNRVVA